MDSTTAIQAVTALKGTLQSQATGLLAQVEALNIVLTILNEGYTTDQNRIDTDIANYKEQHRISVEEKDATIASLTQEVSEKITMLEATAQLLKETEDVIKAKEEMIATLQENKNVVEEPASPIEVK